MEEKKPPRERNPLGLRALIRYEIEQGLAFQRDHPESAEDYRSRLGLEDIAKKYNVAEAYAQKAGNRTACARCIVGFSLRGNPFSELGPVYEGKIPESELNKIQKERAQNRMKTILKMLSTEALRKGGRKGARARGHTLWTEEEITDLSVMNDDLRYHNNRGEFLNALAAEELNAVYNGNRSANGIRYMRGKLLEAAQST
ncbi:MAG: hypothetical protein AABX53_03960 [Nanoarchaeota archaeon]